MGIMISIYKIMNEESNLHQVKFPKYKDDFLIDEYYCINPRCDCQSVRLSFFTLDDDGDIKAKVVGFLLNLNTYKITDIDVFDPSYDFAYLISLYKDSLGKFLYDYKHNYFIAKEYGIRNLSKYVSKDDIKETIKNNRFIGYSELFTITDPVIINVDSDKFIIDDHYCMDPKCDCNHVELYFISYNPMHNVFKAEFSVILNFKLGQFEIGKTPDKLDDERIIMHIINERKELVDLYKTRYYEMKTKGKIITGESTKTVRSNKVGRNEACTCGSGKKYKECCGK